MTYRERFAKIKSSRLQRAVRGIAPDGAEPLMLVTTAAKEPKLSSKREARVVKGKKKKGKTPNQVGADHRYIHTTNPNPNYQHTHTHTLPLTHTRT